MKKDEKITLWSERIHEFQSSGRLAKHGVRNIAFQSLQ